ncbi:MAG: AAA family ATPase [Saprospiraceae bacterium]|nr:AAA family ATPase [Saprospiraceae bacterium]
MKKKRLPLGVQDFRLMREDNNIYIDKTELIYQLLTEGYYYFLSRPRRFGKSLLLSTLKEIFSGSKELFKGLWIEDKWDWSQTHPIVHISFAAAGFKEIGLARSVNSIINRCAASNNIILTEESNAFRFRELLEKLNAKKGKVVVLIDEYDKPIIDYIDNIPQADENRDILRDFYVVLKDNPQYLRFVFITGITKFSKVSIFSALNHLTDITLNDTYASLLGYTQEELESSFKEYMPQAMKANEMTEPELLDALKFWYNGYSWDGETKMYNPFSIINFFNDKSFKNFWFSTGTPTFLTILARQQQFYDLSDIEADQTGFDTFDVDNLNAQATMFQTGYLTIKKYDFKNQIYTLSYPNNEVRKAFLAYMIEAYSFVQVNNVSPIVIKMKRAFERKDIEMVIELVNKMFSNIPYSIFDGTSEKYFHSLMHLLLHYLGTNIESEVNTNKGRLDSVVQTPQYIYILEFKFDKSAQVALDDIEKRGYVEKYSHSQKEIIGVGINFSSKKKCINEWKIKEPKK